MKNLDFGYSAIVPFLSSVNLTNERTLCTIELYTVFSGCPDCTYLNTDAKSFCELALVNTKAQQLKKLIISKHPELLL